MLYKFAGLSERFATLIHPYYRYQDGYRRWVNSRFSFAGGNFVLEVGSFTVYDSRIWWKNSF